MTTAQKFTTPYDMATKQRQLDSRRKMLEAMQAHLMKPQMPNQVGSVASRYTPMHAIAQLIGAWGANRQMGGLAEQESALGSQMEQARQAQEAQERQRMLLESLHTKLGSRTTPETLRESILQQDPSKMQFYEPKIEAGNVGEFRGVQKTSPTGEQSFQFEPKGTSVNIDNVGKAGQKLNEESAKFFAYGGKGYEKAAEVRKNLMGGLELLTTLEMNPQMGAGADAFQFARKWAQTLGAPISDATTPTELAKMQLGQKVLDRLGGLGAQVSDADRKFMLDTQGALGSDPEAVRQMILIETKYLMKAMEELRMGAEDAKAKLGGDLILPDYTFRASFNPQNANDLEKSFNNQPLQAPPPAAPQLPTRFKRRAP